jgi:hypothetical protein
MGGPQNEQPLSLMVQWPAIFSPGKAKILRHFHDNAATGLCQSIGELFYMFYI